LTPILVGGFNDLGTYEFVNGKDDNPFNPYIIWKMKAMFETINQLSFWGSPSLKQTSRHKFEKMAGSQP
jgi:hypothetical protein